MAKKCKNKVNKKHNHQSERQVGRKILIPMSPITPGDLKTAAKIVDESGAMELWKKFIREDGFSDDRPGRQKMVPERAVLILLIYLGINKRSLHIAEVNRIILYRLTPAARELLGLEAHAIYNHTRDVQQQGYERTYAAFKRLVKPLDLFPDTQYRVRLSLFEHRKNVAKRIPSFVKLRRQRSQQFYSALIMASARLIGDDFDQWRGDVALDGTPFIAAKVGTPSPTTDPKKNPQEHEAELRRIRTSSEEDAGWYTRDGGHRGDGKTSSGKFFWAYEATIAAMTGGAFGTGELPGLIIGLSLDRPGVQPAQRALDALTHIMEDPDQPKGNFIGDLLYAPGQDPKKFQEIIRKNGYRIISDIKNETVTVKGKDGDGREISVTASSKGEISGHHKGAVFVDGSWYCPAITDRLVAFTKDKNNKELQEPELQKLIKKREQYQLKIKETTKEGHIKVTCPARRPNPTIVCPYVQDRSAGSGVSSSNAKAMASTLGIKFQRKPRRPSVKPKTHVKTRTSAKKNLPSIISHQLPDEPEEICTNKSSLTIRITVQSKRFQQGPAWATQKWFDEYHRGRNIIESRNSLIKNASGIGLGDRTTRMARGFANHWLFIAIGCVATNVNLINNYFHRLWRGSNISPLPDPPGRIPQPEVVEEPGWPNAPPIAV